MNNVTKLQKIEDLTKLNISELMAYGQVLSSYLKTHGPDTSKGCAVDINDRPFDRSTYEQKRQEWYAVWVEYLRRPVEEGLEIRL